jgi:hypothetical protein
MSGDFHIYVRKMEEVSSLLDEMSGVLLQGEVVFRPVRKWRNKATGFIFVCSLITTFFAWRSLHWQASLTRANYQ